MKAFVIFADTIKQVLHQSSLVAVTLTLAMEQVSHSFSETMINNVICIQDETISAHTVLEQILRNLRRTFQLLIYPLSYTCLPTSLPYTLVCLFPTNRTSSLKCFQSPPRSTNPSLATYVWSASCLESGYHRGSRPFLQVIGAKALMLQLVLRLSC